MTDEDVDRLLQVEPFSRIDETRFSPSLPLRGVLRNDARIVRYGPGELIVREGDYGHSAFFVLSGRVRVVLDGLPPAMLGRREPQRKTLLAALTQRWTNHRVPEVRDAPSRSSAASPHGSSVFVQDLSVVLRGAETPVLGEGEMFGELAALGRTPRTATVVADGDVELLEIRWQGLRELRLRTDALRAYIDRLYRERALTVHLGETWLFERLTPAELKDVADQTEFETYGHFEWYGSYASAAAKGPAERLLVEPVIAEEGHYANGVILIRAGFARVSHRYGAGDRTVNYLGRGHVFGMEEVVHNCQQAARGVHLPLQHTLRAVGYVDVLRVPTAVVEQYVLPRMTPADLERLAPARRDGRASASDVLDPDMLDFLVDGRYINGTATMVIDLDRCTRCDDCVRACASTHDGNPRFLRHGPVHGRHMIANACMHCQDPVCMIGCPTGAIHRETATGSVVINDNTCIGCGTCAASCPYENIRMVDIRDARGLWIRDSTTMLPIAKATKCDLCVDQWGGPACARACPHDALTRVNLRDAADLAEWLER